MKRYIVLFFMLCFIPAGCEKKFAIEVETAHTPVVKQRFIGRFQENISLYREYLDKITIQKEQGESFDVYSLDLGNPSLRFEYTIKPQNKLLYSMHLDAANILKVKQMGNSEENNVLLLEGETIKEIAKNIGYSESALVAVSPSKQYIIYCSTDSSINNYGLYLYNLKSEQTFQLAGKVDEELLNYLEGNISWSPNEDFVAISKKRIFNTSNGKQLKEINAAKILWSSNGRKLAYIRTEKGYGKTISILDTINAEEEEVFISNTGEYLPGYMVWNDNETRLAFATCKLGAKEELGGISPYKAIYSLDLTAKEAIRVDTAIKMSEDQLANLENIHYDAAGGVIVIATATYSGSDLLVYNINTGESEFYINIEYLHDENNESYVCSTDQGLYFVQGQNVIQLDENMKSTVVFQSAAVVEDIYLSQGGNSMVVMEIAVDEIILRHISSFVKSSI